MRCSRCGETLPPDMSVCPFCDDPDRDLHLKRVALSGALKGAAAGTVLAVAVLAYFGVSRPGPGIALGLWLAATITGLILAAARSR